MELCRQNRGRKSKNDSCCCQEGRGDSRPLSLMALYFATEEEANDEMEDWGRSGAGCRVGGAAGAGAGGCKERAAETGAEPFAGYSGAVERHRAEADHHGGGFPG